MGTKQMLSSDAESRKTPFSFFIDYSLGRERYMIFALLFDLFLIAISVLRKSFTKDRRAFHFLKE